MADLPRLNGVIRALEAGQHGVHLLLRPPKSTPPIAMSTSKFDGVVFEMEHNPWDGRRCAIACSTCSTAAQIVKAGLLAPAVTPMVRVPVNGVEKGAVAGQAGARHRLLRHRVAAHLDGRGGDNAVARLPLSAAEDRDALRAGRHPRRRPGTARRAIGA